MYADKTREVAETIAARLDGPPDAPESKRTSQATRLVELASSAELFHDDDVAYAIITANGHRETHRLRSKHFRTFLRRLYFQETARAPGSQAVEDALGTLEGKAQFDGPARPVHVRLGDYDGAIFLDLGDEDWRIVRIDADGWKVLDDSPVRFRRPKGMQALPIPQKGGSIRDLRPFVNVSSDNDFVLYAGCLLAALNPRGPYPILVIEGEQGSTKSTASRIFRRTFDPNLCELRKDVREPRDLAIAANNGRAISLDNLSPLPAWLSDTLCSLATGGGFSTRALYTDDEEMLFSAARPIALNGIAGVPTRPDLLDRSVILNLPVVSDDKRISERDFWAQFDEAHPRLLGWLLDAVACAVRNLPAVKGTWPRMADFAQWVTAAEPALGLAEGEFLRIYAANRATAHSAALEASPVAEAIMCLIEAEGEWVGTATELLRRLEADEPPTRHSTLPRSPARLSVALRSTAPNLRQAGVEVRFTGTNPRIIEIRKHSPNTASNESTAEGLVKSRSDALGITAADRGTAESPDNGEPLSAARSRSTLGILGKMPTLSNVPTSGVFDEPDDAFDVESPAFAQEAFDWAGGSGRPE